MWGEITTCEEAAAAADARHIARANAKRSAVRSAVEQVFAGQKHGMALFIWTIGIARARIKIGITNVAYNFQRLIWLDGKAPLC